MGNFTLERKLGVGGFATVWLARDEGLESWVAIKVLADNLADDPQVRARFVAEARILRELDYRRIVRVLQVGERDDGRPYFVMEYADGGTLDDRIRRNRQSGVQPSASEAADLATKICEGLAVAHSHGVVHRDLKPSNVLFRQVDAVQRQALMGLTSDAEPAAEELLLADFGIARRLEAVTQAHSRYGTILYMAPEQFSGAGDHRVDLYSTAVVLYQFITGESPFPDEGGMLQIMAAKAEGRVVALRDRRPELPPGLDATIRLALSPDPDERPASALSWAQAVRQAVGGPLVVGEPNPQNSDHGLATRDISGQALPARERVPTSTPAPPAAEEPTQGTRPTDARTPWDRPQQPQRSRPRWRRILLLGLPLAAAAVYFVVAALASLPPFSSSRPLPTIALPTSWNCSDASAIDAGTTRNQTCTTETLPNGVIDVTQFDNAADRNNALSDDTSGGGFKVTAAGNSCPPASGAVTDQQNGAAATQGLVRQPTPEISELRCYTNSGSGPEYDWIARISGKNVYLSASAGQNDTFATLDHWWSGGHPDGLQYSS